MGFLKSILSYLGRNLKISKERAHEIVDLCDEDKDGFISLSELWDLAYHFAQDMRK